MDEKEWRVKILEKIEDLKKKIEENEPLPESEQDLELLCHVDDCLDQALNCWYY